MIVVGGTYEEYCRYPLRNRVMGSGLRAALLLSKVVPDVSFYSAVDDTLRETAEITAGSFDLELKWSKRNSPVSFGYITPLFPPAIDSSEVDGINIEVETHENALVFGMIESSTKIKAKSIILDPQQPKSNMAFHRSDFSCDRFALVANKSETTEMARDSNVKQAALKLQKEFAADVVVTKLGAIGALVTTAKGQNAIGPLPTTSVMPIGSGDAFAAGFAWAWAEQGMDSVAAARVGSKFAAYHVYSEDFPSSRAQLDECSFLSAELTPREPRIYLAGPFFSLSEQILVDSLFKDIVALGADVFSPYHDVGFGGDEVVAEDLKGIEESDAVLALLDNADPGTVYEVGWASQLGRPVIGYATDKDSDALKMLRGSGVKIVDDLSTAVYRAIWLGMGGKKTD